MKLASIRPVFVDFIPRELEQGVLYISERYATASHKCACGWCGEKVVTPLSPVEWRLRVEGGLVSLYPSIGNWNFPCRSHYWIRRNRIQWAAALSEEEIRRAQQKDLIDKKNYVEAINQRKEKEFLSTRGERSDSQLRWVDRALRWVSKLFTG